MRSALWVRYCIIMDKYDTMLGDAPSMGLKPKSLMSESKAGQGELLNASTFPVETRISSPGNSAYPPLVLFTGLPWKSILVSHR